MDRRMIGRSGSMDRNRSTLSSSMDRGLAGRSGSMDRGRSTFSRQSESGKPRPGSSERERQSTRARSSLLDVTAQRAPDFRAEKARNIQELIGNIKLLGIDSPEKFNSKTLQCPSTKVFLELFKFLIDMLMPGHILASRHEEEIPYIFKVLGYPFMINRSAVLAITPHSWPQLCHALLWLCQCVSDLPIVYDCLEAPDFLNFVLDVTENPDQAVKFAEEMRRSALDNKNRVQIELEQQLDGLIRQRERFESEMGDTDGLQASIAKEEGNLKKMNDYLEATQSYLEQKEEHMEQQRQSIQNLTTLIAEKRSQQERLELEHKERATELSPEERSTMCKEQQELLERIKNFTAENEKINNKINESEMRMMKRLKEVDDLEKRYNATICEHIDPAVADELRLTNDITKKVANIVEPYLTKTAESLLNDEVLQQLHKKREGLDSKLMIAKSELDKERQHLQRCQDSGSASLEALTNSCQMAQEKNEIVKKEVQSVSVEAERLLEQEKELTESLIVNESAREALKFKHEEEERRRAAALQAEYNLFKQQKIVQQRQIDREMHQLEEMKSHLLGLKVQLKSIIASKVMKP